MNRQQPLQILLTLAALAGWLTSAAANEYANHPAKVMEQRFKYTGRELDVAIDGAGYLQLTDPAGLVVYTRWGKFGINEHRQLTVGKVRVVEPAISIPSDTTGVVISSEGDVLVKQPGSPQLHLIGKLQVATFENTAGLKQIDVHTFAQTAASGSPQVSEPGTAGSGLIRQGMLNADASN